MSYKPCPNASDECKYFETELGCVTNLLVSYLIRPYAFSGCSDSLFPAPALLLNPRYYGVHVNVINSRPLRYTLTNTIQLYRNYLTTVIDLLSLTRPATVFRGVITVIINSIKRVFRSGLLAHVFKKLIKPSSAKPLLVNLNSSTSIPVITPVVRVVASCFHSSPRIILRSINRMSTMSIITCPLSKMIHAQYYNVWIRGSQYVYRAIGETA